MEVTKISYVPVHLFELQLEKIQAEKITPGFEVIPFFFFEFQWPFKVQRIFLSFNTQKTSE
jgi:hypothetical protein